MDPLRAFAIAAPGLEPLVAAELTALGLANAPGQGGVAFDADERAIARANLWLRTGSRVVVRAAEFDARTFAELERHGRRVPWERFVAPGGSVRFRVTSKKSRLYHTDGIAQRLGESIEHRMKAHSPWTTLAADDDEQGDDRAQLFVVRVFRDHCTVSADTSGELLHRRGYRQAVAKAPLRETLAAAAVLGAGWRGDRVLVDPLCGSGTIPIEAAMIARNMAPGVGRTFAAMRWPGSRRDTWAVAFDEARAAARARSPVALYGSDRDAGAIEAAHANAERAGVVEDVVFEVRPVSGMRTPGTGGFIVTNPPYGVRVGEAVPLRNLFAHLGNAARSGAPGGTIALLSPDQRLDAQLRLPLREAFRTSNGGIPVHLVCATLPDTHHAWTPTVSSAAPP